MKVIKRSIVRPTSQTPIAISNGVPVTQYQKRRKTRMDNARLLVQEFPCLDQSFALRILQQLEEDMETARLVLAQQYQKDIAEEECKKAQQSQPGPYTIQLVNEIVSSIPRDIDKAEKFLSDRLSADSLEKVVKSQIKERGEQLRVNRLLKRTFLKLWEQDQRLRQQSSRVQRQIQLSSSKLLELSTALQEIS